MYGGIRGRSKWEAEVKLYHTLEQRKSHRIIIEAQKQPQCMSGQDGSWQQFDTMCRHNPAIIEIQFIA